MNPVDTHCPYCALQCAMTLTPTAATPGTTPARPADAISLPVTIAGRAFPTNRGGLCKKGWTAADLLGSADRIREPMQRAADGSFAPVSWTDALDLIAEKLRTGRAEHGADSVGVFGGGGLTNE